MQAGRGEQLKLDMAELLGLVRVLLREARHDRAPFSGDCGSCCI